jgi:Lactonase, 7-bladed beta-propeller
MRRRFASSIALLLLLLVPSTGLERKNASRSSYLMYVGTYTGPNGKGIYAYRFNAATGQATRVGPVAERTHRFWLSIPTSDFCMRLTRFLITRCTRAVLSVLLPSIENQASLRS